MNAYAESMTVKTRITLLIAGAGFLASLLFSVVVFFELIEQPLDILDAVLREEAYGITEAIVKRQQTEANAPVVVADRTIYAYWIRVYDGEDRRLLYQSDLAKTVRLTSVKPGSRAIVSVTMPPGQLSLRHNDNGEVTFRVTAFRIPLAGREYLVRIARPIEQLEEEIRDLVVGILSGLILSTLLLIGISRLVAGKILRPIGAMQELTKDISEKNLERRIPCGTGRDEFSELAGTINHMLDRLQYSFARQQNFLYDTSHELKTPLTTMRLTIDEMCLRSSEEDPLRDEENLFRLRKQVLRMERLVKDLLNLSALETLTGITRQPVSVTSLLSSLIKEYRLLADAHHIAIVSDFAEELVVLGDGEKLQRAFSNILDNALKYNVDGGRVEITGERVGAEVVITIGNTGQVVPAAEVSKVFEQFYRVEKSRSLRLGGSGLGLAIVKRIVELHGGLVSFASSAAGLNRVEIRLPLDREFSRNRE